MKNVNAENVKEYKILIKELDSRLEQLKSKRILQDSNGNFVSCDLCIKPVRPCRLHADTCLIEKMDDFVMGLKFEITMYRDYHE